MNYTHLLSYSGLMCPKKSIASSRRILASINTHLLINHVMLLCSYLGTRLRFHRGPNVEWQEADELGDSDDDSDDETMMPSSSSPKVDNKFSILNSDSNNSLLYMLYCVFNVAALLTA